MLRGRFRMTQGDHVIEVGPGDYVRWDGTIPHDAEVLGDDEGAMLIIALRPATDRSARQRSNPAAASHRNPRAARTDPAVDFERPKRPREPSPFAAVVIL